ncbi:MAG: CotH kinase family protein [Planctomycetota bacterium]|nr:CotH kinase family protein [Planctomycetota bacterium]
MQGLGLAPFLLAFPGCLLALLWSGGSATSLEAQVVINEIHYHPGSDLKDDEFIELHNAGDASVALGGWAFTDGVRFEFPPGTAIPAGGFLVVARDAPRIRAKYGLPSDAVVGNYGGALSNGGERLALSDAPGRAVDVVTYSDEFPWPEEADGSGPSLECVNSRRENDTARNWLPSENRTSWVPVFVEGNATSNRLYLYLEGAGECLIDDLRITGEGSTENLFPEGDFEAGAAGFEMTGTHSQSFLTTADARSGRVALHLIATGPGRSADTSVNRVIEALIPGQDYTLAFWAKPLSGNSSLTNRVSGGGLLARTDLRWLEGTPGEENSSRSDNLPPLIADFWTEPALPRPGTPVTLLAAVEDEDVLEVVGVYDFGEGPRVTTLRDDGRSGDGAPGDGVFGGAIPPAPHGAIVGFRAEAVDSAGQRVETPMRRYPVAEFDVVSELPVYHVFIREEDWARLNADIWTDEYFPAVFVHEGRVFSDVGLRFRGGRPRLFRKKSLKLAFPDAQLFRGRRRLNLNAAAMDDDYITEPLAYWLYARVGLEASEARLVRVELNGEFWGLFVDVEQVDERYLERFGLDPRGALYKSVGIVGSHRKLDGVRYNGQEYTYESQYEKKTRKDEPHDDLIEFIHGLYDTPPAVMEAYLAANLDVEQYINYLATSNVMCIWDNIQHNFYFYRDTEGTGKWRVLPWDLDHAWGEWEWNYYYDATYHLYMGTRSHPFANVWYTWNQLWTVLLDVPRYRTMYLERIRELLNTQFAEGPVFRKIDALRAEVEATARLDEARWPDSREPQHTGPRRTMAQEIPILKQTFTRRRRYLARMLGVTLIDVPAAESFRRGDVDRSTAIDLSDAVQVLSFLFLGGTAPRCEDAADADDSGVVDLSDAITILSYLFLGGFPPPAPGPTVCGEDPTSDGLRCDDTCN